MSIGSVLGVFMRASIRALRFAPQTPAAQATRDCTSNRQTLACMAHPPTIPIARQLSSLFDSLSIVRDPATPAEYAHPSGL